MADWSPSCLSNRQRSTLVVDSADSAEPTRSWADQHAGVGEFRERRGDGYVDLCPGVGSRVVVNSMTGSVNATSVELIDIGLIHALALEGAMVFHASVFEVYGTRVIAVADSGSGKSTLAAAAVRCGGRVVSDDAVVAVRNTGSVTTASFRRDLFLRSGSVAVLPEDVQDLMVETIFVDGPRATLERDACPEVFTPIVEPDRLWALELDTSRFRGTTEPISGSEAAVALIRSSTPLHLTPRFGLERSNLLPILTGLVEQAETSRVVLGTDLMKEPEVAFQRLLE